MLRTIPFSSDSVCYYRVHSCACDWFYEIPGYGHFCPGQKQMFELLTRKVSESLHVPWDYVISSQLNKKINGTINKTYLKSKTQVKENLYINMFFIFQSQENLSIVSVFNRKQVMLRNLSSWSSQGDLMSLSMSLKGFPGN